MLGIPQNDPRLSFEGNMWVSCADGSTHWELYWGPCTLYRGPTPYQDQDPNTILCAGQWPALSSERHSLTAPASFLPFPQQSLAEGRSPIYETGWNT